MSIIYDVMSMYVLYSTTVYLQYTTISNDEKELLNSFDHLKFQDNLKLLYKLKFEKEHLNIQY